VRAVNHAKFKTTKIYSQGILVDYSKICTNENFLLYGRATEKHSFFSASHVLQKKERAGILRLLTSEQDREKERWLRNASSY